MVVRLDVWESVSADNTLCGNSSNGAHGKTSIQKLGILLLLHGSGVTGSKGVPCIVTGFTFSIHHGDTGGSGHNEFPKSNPHQKLSHGSGQESVVGIDGLGDGLEGVLFSGDADKVGGDETNDGQHGGTSVTDLGLTEPWDKRRVGIAQSEL